MLGDKVARILSTFLFLFQKRARGFRGPGLKGLEPETSSEKSHAGTQRPLVGMVVSMSLEAADEKTVAINLEEGEAIAEASQTARQTDMIR